MSKILLAGATGYLGGYLLQELIRRNIPTRAIVRSPRKLASISADPDLLEVKSAEVTQPESISGCCEGVDTLISSVGITRQKDGLTYMDVDYQANLNLLREAQRAGVKKFVYVSVLNGDQMRDLAICEAKEKFVDELKASGLEYCIVRPNGFFSDMAEFLQMAKSGRVYLFGKGNLKINPIHGADLAVACVDQIEGNAQELEIGGPETFTQDEIAEVAFKAIGKEPKIMHLPDWIRRTVLGMGKAFMSKAKYGPFEFFLTAMALEMEAPEYGEHTLLSFYQELESATTQTSSPASA